MLTVHLAYVLRGTKITMDSGDWRFITHQDSEALLTSGWPSNRV
jgi:hypothetical protein